MIIKCKIPKIEWLSNVRGGKSFSGDFYLCQATSKQTWVNTTRPYTTTTNNQSCIGWKHPTTTSGVGCFGVHYIQLSKMLLQGWCWLAQKITTLLNKMLYEKVGVQHLTNICCMAMLVTTFLVTAMLVGFFEIQLLNLQMLQRVVALYNNQRCMYPCLILLNEKWIESNPQLVT